MRRSEKFGLGLAFAALVLAGSSARPALAQLGEAAEAIPTARVKRGQLDLKVYTTGEMRATRAVMLVAPPVGGGTLKIIRLLKTGTGVKAGDLVVEFDPSEQQYNLEQNRSELLQAEQEITKAKADAAVQTAQDKVALLKAKFEGRQAELEVSKNELVSAIDAKKNLLRLEEARRALAQLEQDIKSHAASNRATLAVAEEKRHKARLAMQQARQNIENMRVRSPLKGLVEVKPNQDAAGGIFFTGMSLPDYREGDQVSPGSFVAQVLDTAEMEIQAKVNESDRAALRPGQSVEVRVDALPGQTLSGKVKTLAGMASSELWGGDTMRKFDISFQLERPDPRLRPGFTTHLIINGDQVKNVLYLPRQALFEKNGKPIVYVRNGDNFEEHEVKVKEITESSVAIAGLKEGTEVALVNPEKRGKGPPKPAGPLVPAAAGGSR